MFSAMQSNVLRIIFTGRNNTHTAFQNRILCLMTHGWWERHMIIGEKQNQATRHAAVINISRSKVFSSFRKESFAPPGDIYVYIHLLGVYTYTLTTKFFAFTFPWMKSITARLSAKFRQALPTNNLCALYTTFQNPGWQQAILNHTVMHNCGYFWSDRDAHQLPRTFCSSLRTLPSYDFWLPRECKQRVARDAQKRCCPS